MAFFEDSMATEVRYTLHLGRRESVVLLCEFFGKSSLMGRINLRKEKY